MANPKKPDAAAGAPPVMTVADVVKLVKRTVPVLDDKTGKPTDKTKQVAVKVDEVHDFKEYDDHVMVLTIDGVKLRGDK